MTLRPFTSLSLSSTLLEMADKAAELPPEPARKPADSPEVDEEIKEEETGDGAGGVSKELYREMRAICDALSNHRLTVRGDE